MLTLTPIAGLVVAMLIAGALTPLVRSWATRFGSIDKESTRKIHAGNIPRLGGVAIAAGFYAPLLALSTRVNLFESALFEQPKRVTALLVGGAIILALGVWDDFRGASAHKKLAVQIPVAIMTWVLGVRIGTTQVAGVHLFVLPAWLSLITTVGWIVLCVNAFNLIDGLDGLASGVALQALLTTAICAWHRDDAVLAFIAICLSGSVAGFLIHNFHPATIFMGDSGSMLLGYVIATASIWSSQKTATAIGTVLPMLVLALPLLDTSLTVWRRFLAGQRLFDGDLDHIHHRVLALASTHRRSVLLLYGVSLAFNGLSLATVWVTRPMVQWIILGTALVLAFALARWLGYVRPRAFASSAVTRRRNLFVRGALLELEQRLVHAETTAQLDESLAQFEKSVRPHYAPETPAAEAEPEPAPTETPAALRRSR